MGFISKKLDVRIKKAYDINVRRGNYMTVREIEKIIKADGWYEIRSNSGSHRQFKHPTKKG